MEWIYKLIPNYGWDIILFTLLITVIKIPSDSASSQKEWEKPVSSQRPEPASTVWQPQRQQR